MTDTELYQRCKDEWEMQVEIFRGFYANGYNDAKREIALSGEYERAYQRGRDSVIAVIEEIKADIEKQIKFYAFSEEKWVAHKNDGIKIALSFVDKRLAELKGDEE